MNTKEEQIINKLFIIRILLFFLIKSNIFHKRTLSKKLFKYYLLDEFSIS